MIHRTTALVLFALSVPALPAQRLASFSTPLPLKPGDTLVIGFLGGFEKWNDPHRGVRKLALDLRAIPGVYAETIENRHRNLALTLIRRALDSNGNRVLEPEERARARIVLYGQSLGAEAAIDVARQLDGWGVKVLETVQVDSVGLHAGTIPPNVAAAANFYQREPFTIWGRNEIHAADPTRTVILGNFRVSYRERDVDESSTTWVRRALGGGHAKMELDPAVWAAVKDLILSAMGRY